MPAPDVAFRTTLSPEAEFVLLSARTRLEGARRERWNELLCDWIGQGSSSWEAVLHLAGAHRVTGLLGRHLSARGWRDVPPFAVCHIQQYFGFIASHSVALKNELADVSHALESAAIPVVSFKGATLALSVYGNAAVRPSADIDLLVSRRDIERALQILRGLGYAPEAELSRDQEQVHLRVDSVFNLSRPAPEPLQDVLSQGYAVELHWAITSPCLPFDLDFEALEPHLSTIELPGVPAEKAVVRALCAEDLLLILCVHGAKHLWERLIWLCDVAELVAKTPDLDWPRVMQEAEARGVRRMTALGLALARDVLGTALPFEVQTWLTTQPEALRLAARLRASLLVPPPQASPDERLPHDLSKNRLLMQTIDAPAKRLGFLWHVFTAPTINERATVALLQELDFLWWILRPARVIQKRWPLGKSHPKSR